MFADYYCILKFATTHYKLKIITQNYRCCSANNPREIIWATSKSVGHGSEAMQPNTPHSWRNCLSSSSIDIFDSKKKNKIEFIINLKCVANSLCVSNKYNKIKYIF